MDGSTDQKNENLISHVSDDAVSRPKKGFDAWIERWGLVMILAVMCLIIAVLVGFVFVEMNRGGEEILVTEGDGEEWTEEMAALEAESNARHEAYMETTESAKLKAQEVLSASSPDLAAADLAFQQAIDSYVQNRDYGNAEGVMLVERKVFAENGSKCELLNFWTVRDYGDFGDIGIYDAYYFITWLAEECGNAEIAAAYEQKALEYGPQIDGNPFMVDDIGGNI